MRMIISPLIVSAYLWGVGQAFGETLACEAYNLTVVAENLPTAQHACDALAAQRSLLDACGLIPERSYALRIVRKIEEGPGNCLARYHCDAEAIEVIGPDWLRAAIEPGSVLNRLDPGRLFVSLVVHEWTHAVFDEVTEGAARDLGDQEYVAFAMQLAALSPEDRQTWLAAYPGREPVQHREINAVVAALDPPQFATRAWRHFAAENNGCSTVRDLISGKSTFRLYRF